MSEEPYDAHVQKASKLFREAGFSLAAMQYPRSPSELKALLDFNGAPEGWKPPFAWQFFPNSAMKDFWARKP